MRVLIFCLTVFLVTLKSAAAYEVKYENYKVYRFSPQDEPQRNILMRSLEENPALMLWNEGAEMDIMIPPHMQYEAVRNLVAEGIPYSVFIEDVQKLIDEETLEMQKAEKSTKLSWTTYHSSAVINDFLSQQAAAHPNIAQVVNVGRSEEGRDLKLIKISKGGNKPIIWVDALLHSREWISAAVATYLINDLLNSNAANIKQLTEDYDFYIMPVMNPDGYEYSRTSERLWRKTRSRVQGSTCRGADPNRNWGYRWNSGGASSNPCSDTYAGRSAFSEVETRQTSQYIQTIGSRIKFYLSLHSYSQMILLPYGHTNQKIPEYQEWMRIGRLAVQSLASRYGTRFTPGNIVDLLYVATGGSMDWVKATFNTQLTYTFEMRDTGRYGFLLPPAQIVPSSLEFMDGLLAIVGQLRSNEPVIHEENNFLKPNSNKLPIITPIN